MLQAPSFMSSHSLLAFALYAALIYVLCRAAFQLFLSPLSVVPGPWYAAVSDLWLVTHIARLRQCMAVHELFETYGPVVRVGPNKVVFRDASSAKNVYAVQKFDKTAFYKAVQTCVFGCVARRRVCMRADWPLFWLVQER